MNIHCPVTEELNKVLVSVFLCVALLDNFTDELACKSPVQHREYTLCSSSATVEVQPNATAIYMMCIIF